MDSKENNLLPRISTFLCFFLHLTSAAATDNSSSTSSAFSYFRISCGAIWADATDMKGLYWKSDERSEHAPNCSNTNISSIQQKSDELSIPYSAARIFHSSCSYNFLVGAGWKFIRLYFYPANYSGLGQSKALFNVTSGRYTLLRDFSVYNTTKAFNLEYLVREFCIYSEEGLLNITFAPSRNIPNAYAFANGMEVVSMPDVFLRPYWVVVDKGQPLQQYSLEQDTALETVTRLNVGGQEISPANDSGLFRTWINDSLYLLGAATGVTLGWELHKRFEYTTKVPRYVAPEEVYQSGRSMGPDTIANNNYNLTWIFSVDPGFRYLFRLHFCEIVPSIDKENQRVFEIFIYNKTAETEADLVTWAKVDTGVLQNGIPVYRDYVIMVPKGEPQPQNLWLELHPSTAVGVEYRDALLNGIEIFKLSDGNNLGGPNPIPEDRQGDPNRILKRKEKRIRAVVVGATVGSAATAIAICCVVCSFLCRHGRLRREQQKDAGASKANTTGSGKGNTAKRNPSSHASSLCRHFSIAEIRKVTNDFDEDLCIGVGGFGKVYRGAIDKDATQVEVAIKRANPQSDQGLHEFQTEIEMLSKLRHRHLVSLIGFCDENSEMILVYDYMSRGTLREHLCSSLRPPLPWKQRLEICIGAARGLHYLHRGTNHFIIHRDVKSTNILLDENWVAKVSDFGLSKMSPTLDDTHVSTMVKGSFGYLDPEYFRRHQLTDKSDVFSFGVVLFEVLCGRQALDPALPEDQVNLAEWTLHCKNKGMLEEIIDPHLRGMIMPECLKTFTDTAEKCLADRGVDRPAMGDVVWNLELALRLQESVEGVGSIEELGQANERMTTPSSNSMNLTDSRSSRMSISIGSCTSNESVVRANRLRAGKRAGRRDRWFWQFIIRLAFSVIILRICLFINYKVKSCEHGSNISVSTEVFP